MNNLSNPRASKPPRAAPGSRLTLAPGIHLTLDQAVSWAGVSRRTAQAWRRNPDRIPAAARQLLTIRATGRIPGLPGARIEAERIILDCGYEWTVDQLLGITWTIQERDQLRVSNRALRAENARLRQYIDVWRAKVGLAAAANDQG